MKKIVCLCIAILLLSSCAASRFESKIKEVELGMSKRKVVSILGTGYEPAGARMTIDGPVETISYRATSLIRGEEDCYILSFQNGKLVEWFKEIYPVQPNQPYPNRD